MNEYENPTELPRENAHYEIISNPGDCIRGGSYSPYAGAPNTPSEYRYVPKAKTKKFPGA